MRRIYQYVKWLIVALIIPATIVIHDRKDVLAMDLRQFQWKKRLLFLFAPAVNHLNFEKLHNEIVRQADEVKDRDLIVFEIVEQGASRMDTAPLDRQTADSIRDQFAIPPKEFTVILVGKDGGVKLKRDDHVNVSAIFDLIDSMPMRQNELRRRKQ